LDNILSHFKIGNIGKRPKSARFYCAVNIAKEHIQCLIDCILQLMQDRTDLADTLEATTIDVNGTRYNMKTLKKSIDEESVSVL